MLTIKFFSAPCRTWRGTNRRLTCRLSFNWRLCTRLSLHRRLFRRHSFSIHQFFQSLNLRLQLSISNFQLMQLSLKRSSLIRVLLTFRPNFLLIIKKKPIVNFQILKLILLIENLSFIVSDFQIITFFFFSHLVSDLSNILLQTPYFMFFS